MLRRYRGAAVVFALLLLPAWGAAAQMGVAIRVGTLGPGVEIARQIVPMLAVRLAGSYLPPMSSPAITLEDEDVDVEFTGDASLKSFAGLVDFTPFGAGFRLSGGVVYNASQIQATGVPLDDYTLLARTFTAADLGTLTATLDYDTKIAPYGGVGFGSVARGGLIGMVFDLGVIFTGPPDISFSGNGMLEPTGTVNQPVIQDALDGIQLYPVISFGLAVRF